jgi:hypothetical protein
MFSVPLTPPTIYTLDDLYLMVTSIYVWIPGHCNGDSEMIVMGIPK